MPSHSLQPRDPAKSAAYFSKIAALYDKEVTGAIKMKSDAVLGFIAFRQLRVASALYSSGAAVSQCMEPVAGAASFFTRYMLQGVTKPLLGIPSTEDYVECMSMAYLCDAMPPCERAFRAAKIQNVPPWQKSVLSLVATVFDGKKKLPKDFDLEGAVVDWAPRFTDMFLAALHRDHSAFPETMEAYFRERWGPSQDRCARNDLKSTPPVYVGKWAFHAAALCKLMGGVPPLSKKVLQYVPIELVDSGSPGQDSPRRTTPKAAKRGKP